MMLPKPASREEKMNTVILFVWWMFGVNEAAWLSKQWHDLLRYLDRYHRVGRHSEFGRVIVQPTMREVEYLNRHREPAPAFLAVAA